MFGCDLSFVLIQSPLSLYISWPFWFFFKKENRTWWPCMCSVKTKKEKNLGTIIGIIMWTWSFLVGFLCFFFEPDLWKLVQRRERQRCAGQLQQPFLIFRIHHWTIYFFQIISYLGSFSLTVSKLCVGGSSSSSCCSSAVWRRELNLSSVSQQCRCGTGTFRYKFLV